MGIWVVPNSREGYKIRQTLTLRIEDWGDLKKSGTGRNFDGELRSKSHNLGRF